MDRTRQDISIIDYEGRTRQRIQIIVYKDRRRQGIPKKKSLLVF